MLLQLGRQVDAISCFDQALVLDAKMVVTWFHKAMAEEQAGRLMDAAHSYERFIDSAPPQYAAGVKRAGQRIRKLNRRK
jgi:predicted TPR repeat methyltransferase